MKKLITFCSLVLLIVASACENKKSVQNYLVTAGDKEGFITGDLPVSSVLTPKADVTDDVRATINSIKKINVAFLPKNAENGANYEQEKATLQDIFKDNDKYKSLMQMKMKGMNVKVFYTGNTDAIDEVIAFGYSNEVGVGVARLLGENMNPAKVMEMLKNVNMNEDQSSLEQFGKLFGK